MARQLGAIVNDVMTNLARTDQAAKRIVINAINMAIEITYQVFEIPASRRYGQLVFPAGVDELEIAPRSQISAIIDVINQTDGVPMGFIPVTMLALVTPSEGVPSYYSRMGNHLLICPTPQKNTEVRVRYTVHPTRLTEDTQELPFEGYEGFIIALATATSWASLEEPDSANAWNNIVTLLAQAYGKETLLRSVIEGLRTDVVGGGTTNEK